MGSSSSKLDQPPPSADGPPPRLALALFCHYDADITRDVIQAHARGQPFVPRTGDVVTIWRKCACCEALFASSWGSVPITPEDTAGVYILAAATGVRGQVQHMDVTNRIQLAIDAGDETLDINPTTLGCDPLHGVVKRLLVVSARRGIGSPAITSGTVEEYSALSLRMFLSTDAIAAAAAAERETAATAAAASATLYSASLRPAMEALLAEPQSAEALVAVRRAASMGGASALAVVEALVEALGKGGLPTPAAVQHEEASTALGATVGDPGAPHEGAAELAPPLKFASAETTLGTHGTLARRVVDSFRIEGLIRGYSRWLAGAVDSVGGFGVLSNELANLVGRVGLRAQVLCDEHATPSHVLVALSGEPPITLALSPAP